MVSDNEKFVLAYIQTHDNVSSVGKRKSTRYFYSKEYTINFPIDVEDYFNHEIDERNVRQGFNFELIKGGLILYFIKTLRIKHVYGIMILFKRGIYLYLKNKLY